MPAIRLLMEKANLYSKQKSGVLLWNRMEVAAKQVKGHLLAGHCFGCFNSDGSLLAMIALTEEDPYMWGKEGQDGSALYCHKLMKDPETSPKGIGLILIAFVANEALRRHKKYLRCDSKASLRNLLSYYQGLGLATSRVTYYPSSKEEAVLLQADPREVIEKIKLATA